jgi:SAM-dependent methyltransferase
MKLNLGCGRDIRPKSEGWVNIDVRDGPGVDVRLDLAEGKLPFPDNSVDHVLASHVLEHLHDWEYLLLEVHRVLKPGGTVEIRAPYGLDPTAFHVRVFKEWSLDLFYLDPDPDENPLSLESGKLFDLEQRTINRRFPFEWHVKRHLRVRLPRQLNFIGKKHEIVWLLKKTRRVAG